jgi:hypothetical protein
MRISPVAREAALAGLGVLILHLLLRIPAAPGAFQDDAIYLALGKALASGEGWRSLYAAGQPVHLKYPPGLPAAYAVAWWLGGTLAGALTIVRGLHLVIAGGAGALAWWTARVRCGTSVAGAAAVLLPLGLVSAADHFQLAIAEGPFVAAWLGAVALAVGPLTTRRAVALGLVLALAALLRTQGLVVLAGVIAGVALAGGRRQPAAIAAATAAVPLVIWFAWHAWLAARGPLSSQPDEAPYIAELSRVPLQAVVPAMVRTITVNARAYGGTLLPLELGPPGVGHALALGAFALVVVGAIRGGPKLLPLTLSVAGATAAVMAWPYHQSRFVLALLPVAALLAAAGWPHWARRVPPRALAVAALVVVGAIALRQRAIRAAAYAPDAVAAVGFRPVGRTLVANTEWMLAVAPWVRAHTPPDARILTEGAAGLWLATGRAGVAALPAVPGAGGGRTPAPGPADYLRARLLADSITLVIASSGPVRDGVARIADACPDAFAPGIPIVRRRAAPAVAIAVAYTVNAAARSCLAAGAAVTRGAAR